MNNIIKRSWIARAVTYLGIKGVDVVATRIPGFILEGSVLLIGVATPNGLESIVASESAIDITANLLVLKWLQDALDSVLLGDVGHENIVILYGLFYLLIYFEMTG